ncbi:MAG TPA: serine/threonine-protein kinase [Polyangiaceae bacterium]|nr:serine/threonine-protein kinase [Polyangiaceae bacterium]
MDDAIRRGEIISGKYRIEGVLGSGAMGIVYAAHHLQLDERVALKVLRRELAAYPDAVKRFTREARAAAKIKNEHVTRVFDIGELDDGTPFIVMESLEGEDLARRLATRGALQLEEAVAFVLQACEALAEAHALGIVHRDLKPSNLFCYRRPDGSLCIKVLDFGISKVAALATSTSNAGRASGTTGGIGSPFYMSPEQMQAAHDVDHRTDIWALGVILFELLTTTVPFDGESLPEVCIKVATRPPRRLREQRSDLPAELESTILTCLEKQPENRFENLAEFAGSLFPHAGKGARASIERIVKVSRKARTLAANAASESLPAPYLSDAGTIRPLGATVPPARSESKGHLPWVGLGGAAVVALGVILFWTRPVGKGEPNQTEPELAEKAAAQPARLPRVEPIPIKPENLPKAEPRAAAGPSDITALQALSPTAPPPVAVQNGAPAASAGAATVDDVSENKQQRHRALEQEGDRRNRPRAPTKHVTDPALAEPGTDLRQLSPAKRARDIDEANPYAK